MSDFERHPATPDNTAMTTVRTTDGHVYTPWTDGHAVGFLVTSPAGGRELVYLNPSTEPDDSIATLTLYHGPADATIDDHAALSHVDLFTSRCDECGGYIPDTATDIVSEYHGNGCSLHPANVVTAPRPTGDAS